MPGVSMRTTCASSRLRMPWMRLRVVCGLGETIATLRPTIVFTSVDLPAFERPTMATKPDLKGMARIVRQPVERRRTGTSGDNRFERWGRLEWPLVAIPTSRSSCWELAEAVADRVEDRQRPVTRRGLAIRRGGRLCTARCRRQGQSGQ